MKISEKQVIKLIEFTALYAQEIQKNILPFNTLENWSESAIYKCRLSSIVDFLTQITNQQSEELKEVE